MKEFIKFIGIVLFIIGGTLSQEHEEQEGKAVEKPASTAVESCGSKTPVPDFVFLNDCINPPCDIVRGTNSSTVIIFTPDKGAEKFQVKANGKFWIFSRDADLGEQGSQACNYLVNGSCPLIKGKQVKYKVTTPVKMEEFKINGVTVTYRIIKDDNNDDDDDVELACFRVQVNTVDHKIEE